MVTTFAAPKLFGLALPSTLHAMNKPKICFAGTKKSLDSSGNHPSIFQPSALQMKRDNLSHLENSGIRAVSPTECQEINSSPVLETITKQLLVSAVDNRKARQLDDTIAELAKYERLLESGLVFQQNFPIRSFEIGTDFKISIEALMNYLQETKLNHLKSVGILAGGFGLTPEMIVRDLIWVISRYHIEVDSYPSWGDVIQVDTWRNRSGKTAIRRDWLIRDLKTGRTLIRATSLFMMMNKKTRKFTKLSEEVIGDLKPFLMHCDPIINKDTKKLQHLESDEADNVRSGLTSVPRSIVESHELSAVALEYRNECNGDSVLQSLSKVISSTSNEHSVDNDQEIEFDHSLDLEFGSQIMRGRSRWRPKYSN